MLTISTDDHQRLVRVAGLPTTQDAELPSFEEVEDQADEDSHGIQAVPDRPGERLAVECGEELIVGPA